MANRRPKLERRVRPRVALSLRGGWGWLRRGRLRAIIDLAHEWDWDLVDLTLTRGAIPDDLLPSGALVDALPTDPLVERLREMGCPTVRLGRRPHLQDDLLPAVLPDLRAQGRLAAEHFAERGFKHCGYLGFEPLAASRAVFEGLRGRSKSLAMACHLYRLKPGRSTPDETDIARYERRTRQVGEWLTGLQKPVAMLTYRDDMAARICTMCTSVGLSVPEDVAVLGIGNDALTCDVSPVALSSIDTGVAEQGRQGAMLLRSLLAGEPPPDAPVMVAPRGVVARRSTEVLAVSDPKVARAIRVLWDHLEQDVSVDHVAADVGVSRRSLERAFRAGLGRGVNAELRRKRLEHCCHLLKTTDLPIADLAPLTGFRSADYLHVAFRKAFGTTPRKWRMAKSTRGSRNAE